MVTEHGFSESDMTEHIEHEQYSIIFPSLSIHLLMGIYKYMSFPVNVLFSLHKYIRVELLHLLAVLL